MNQPVKMRLVIDVTLNQTEEELMEKSDAFARHSIVRDTDSLFDWWAQGCLYFARMTAHRWLGVTFESGDVKLVGFRPVTTAPPAPARSPDAV